MLTPLIFIHSTHHKAGTMLFLKIERDLAAKYDGKFFVFREENPNKHLFYEKLNKSSKPIFCLDTHSLFDHKTLIVPYKASHMVRDPRDILVSGYNYHLKTTEEWCIKPLKKYNGLSYQEHLKSLPISEGISTELNRMKGTLMKNMLAWDYSNQHILELRFEDLIADFDGTMEKIFSHYGFAGKELEELVVMAAKHDINRMSDEQLQNNKHITNKERKKDTWRDTLNDQHIATMKQRYGDLLIRLGYEKDLNW